MITMHSVSAAYVNGRQAEELQAQPRGIDAHASYEPACLQRWAWQVQAMDHTAGIQDKEQVK